MDKLLEIKNLSLKVGEKDLLSNFDLEMKAHEVHVLMGPNGSGKSSLAMTIAGAPNYEITAGKILLKGEDLSTLEVDARARKGIFLSFQNPLEVPGLNANNFFKHAINAKRRAAGLEEIKSAEFFSKMSEYTEWLAIDEEKIRRNFNVGFSGGEKKKVEILQMLLLEPELIILDEPDSGLDVDALKVVGDAVSKYLEKNAQASLLLITHYNRLLKYIKPSVVHLFKDGKISKSGGAELAALIEDEGYGGE